MTTYTRESKCLKYHLLIINIMFSLTHTHLLLASKNQNENLIKSREIKNCSFVALCSHSVRENKIYIFTIRVSEYLRQAFKKTSFKSKNMLHCPTIAKEQKSTSLFNRRNVLFFLSLSGEYEACCHWLNNQTPPFLKKP